MWGFFIYREKSIRSNHSLHPTVRKLTTDFIHNFILHSFIVMVITVMLFTINYSPIY